MANPSRAPSLTSLPDVILDRYVLGPCLEETGRGQLYAAVDSLLGDEVALELIGPETLGSEGARARLCQEVRLARRVTHPNVCRVLEFGIAPGREGADRPFITSELLVGETLAARLRRVGQLSPTEVRRILPQVLGGLRAIHRAGIAHGHVDAAHIFLARDEKNADRAVVTGFDAARDVDHIAPGAGPFAADLEAMGEFLFQIPPLVPDWQTMRVRADCARPIAIGAFRD